MPSDPKETPTSAAPLQVTSADQWHVGPKKEEGTAIELPSGNVVEARRSMNILRLVQEGQIPNPLRGIVMSMVQTGSMDIPKEQRGDLRVISQFAEFLDTIAIDTVVTPPLDRPVPRGKLRDSKGALVNEDETQDEFYARIQNWEPKPGHLSVYMMDANDKMFLFLYAQGGAADAKTFRAFQDESVADVPPRKKSPNPTKRTGGTGGKRKPKK